MVDGCRTEGKEQDKKVKAACICPPGVPFIAETAKGTLTRLV